MMRFFKVVFFSGSLLLLFGLCIQNRILQGSENSKPKPTLHLEAGIFDGPVDQGVSFRLPRLPGISAKTVFYTQIKAPLGLVGGKGWFEVEFKNTLKSDLDLNTRVLLATYRSEHGRLYVMSGIFDKEKKSTDRKKHFAIPLFKTLHFRSNPQDVVFGNGKGDMVYLIECNGCLWAIESPIEFKEKPKEGAKAK